MNSTLVDDAVERLSRQLPLQARQSALTSVLRRLHQSVIESLVLQGRPPSDEEIVSLVGADQADAAVRRLGGDDLVVLSTDRRSIVGAYPVTTETTPHEVHVSGQVRTSDGLVPGLLSPQAHPRRRRIACGGALARKLCYRSERAAVSLAECSRFPSFLPALTGSAGPRWSLPPRRRSQHCEGERTPGCPPGRRLRSCRSLGRTPRRSMSRRWRY